jgi:hypothetical protein
VKQMLSVFGVERLDWRGCWRSADFWLALATLLLPGGLVLLALQPARIRARARGRR